MSGDFSNAKTDYNDYNIRKKNKKIPSKCNDTHFCESHVAKHFGHQKKMAFPLTPPINPMILLCGLPPRYKVMRIRPTLGDHQWFFGPPICGFFSDTLGPWVFVNSNCHIGKLEVSQPWSNPMNLNFCSYELGGKSASKYFSSTFFWRFSVASHGCFRK